MSFCSSSIRRPFEGFPFSGIDNGFHVSAVVPEEETRTEKLDKEEAEEGADDRLGVGLRLRLELQIKLGSGLWFGFRLDLTWNLWYKETRINIASRPL